MFLIHSRDYCLFNFDIFKIRQPVLKARCRKQFLFVRVCPVWNALPSDLVHSPSLNYLKSGSFTVYLSCLGLRAFLSITTIYLADFLS